MYNSILEYAYAVWLWHDSWIDVTVQYFFGISLCCLAIRLVPWIAMKVNYALVWFTFEFDCGRKLLVNKRPAGWARDSLACTCSYDVSTLYLHRKSALINLYRVPCMYISCSTLYLHRKSALSPKPKAWNIYIECHVCTYIVQIIIFIPA